MKPHDTFLQLAAVAIDFPLGPADRGRLDGHLATCPACRHAAAGLRGDAAAMASLPPVVLPERRASELLDGVLHPATVRHPMRLLLAVALLGLLLLGSLAVGAQLLRDRRDDQLSVVPPLPTATAAPDASPSAPASPEASAPVSSAAPADAGPTGTIAVTRGEALGTADTWADRFDLDTWTTQPLGMGADPAWFADGRLVYACAKEIGVNTTPCVYDPAHPTEPDVEIASDATDPAPAPDGRTIAVHRGMIDVGETWLMGADGSDLRLLSAGSFLRWSPDGAWLAGQPEGAAAQVAIVSASDGEVRVLAPGYDPAWHPSGNRIAYALVDDAGVSIRSVFVADGSVEILVEAPAGTGLGAPAWLPDGRLLYVQDGDIWVFDPAASRPVRLTTGEAVQTGGDAGSLAVSPDGRWVAYTHGTGTDARVSIVATDGGEPVRLPWDGPAWGPRWSPAPVSPDGTPATGGGPVVFEGWEPAGVPVTPGRPIGQVEAVTAGGPGFVAVGRGCRSDADRCEAVVLTSADGTTWVRVPASDALDMAMLIPTSGPELGMFDVAAGGPGVVAVGYAARPGMLASAWFSSDGISWEHVTLGDAGSNRVHAVAWSGRQFVIVGEDRSDWDGTLEGMAGATAWAAAWTSPDGRTWTRASRSELDVGGFEDTMEDPSTGGMADVVAGPGGLVAVGSVCEGTLPTAPPACQPAAWTSADGSEWERAPGMPETAARLVGVAASDAGYVAVGGGQVVTSADGRTWDQVASIPDVRDVTTVGGRFFATTDAPATFVSANGVDWTRVEVGDPQPGSAADPAAWHYASSGDTAVAIGASIADHEPVALASAGR